MLVQLAIDRAIATITLDSPHNRNALSTGLIDQLTAHLAQACADDGVRAIVLTHTGRTFCAGADLTESGDGVRAGLVRLLELLRAMVGAPKPVVGLIDGHVRAGGMGLVGACDIVVASPDASFAFTEARLGLAASVVSLTTLPRMADRPASRYLLTGEVFDGAAAMVAGLVTEAAVDAHGAVQNILDGLRGCSPQGLAASKQLATLAVRDALERLGDQMVDLSEGLFTSEQGLEGMMSFLQKRRPSWAVGQ